MEEAEERPSKVRKLSHNVRNEDLVLATVPQVSHSEKGSVEGEVGQSPSQLADTDGSVEVAEATNIYEDDESNETDRLPSGEEVAPVEKKVDESTLPLSKSQQKKIRKKAEWEAKREERKAVRKEKEAAKRERKRAAYQTAVQNNDSGGITEPLGQQKKPPPHRPVQLPITILIDCDFDDLMRDNERTSLAAQVTRSYSDNKNSTLRVHLAVCSFGGKLKKRFDVVLGEQYKSWKGTRFLSEEFVDASRLARDWMSEDARSKLAGALLPKDMESSDSEAAKAKALEEAETVYLTSDSPNTLERLKPYSTYIIGGLVDKNREKGICYKRATARGIQTARLPIGEFMDMQSRKILATNHVNEIMLRWLEWGDWGKAFMQVIPKRKGGQLKGQASKDDDQEGSVDVDDGVGDDAHQLLGSATEPIAPETDSALS